MLNLDTDAAIELLRGNVAARETLSRSSYHVLTGIALGELLVGVKKSSQPRIAKAKLDALLERVGLVFADETTSAYYADVRVKLEKRGVPIPQNDIWIAAISLQYDIPLASNDKHFEQIEGLKLVRLTT